ncbi:hypothetical protein ALC53_06515 [Atta colombica]|uniref:Uncharacterized protein n=1 Tax=Atta colombica TaxID=520822 RepID=A0A195BGE6_9HYME|nr:hypothetical protein ALC53_06515 [Atta colombica]
MVTVPSWCTRPTNSDSPSSVSPPGIAFGGMLPPLTGTQVGLQPQRTCGSAIGMFFKLGIIALCLSNLFFYTFSRLSLSVTHLVIAFSMFRTAPGDVADGMTGLHLAGDESTLVMSPTDEKRLLVMSTLDRVGWYHPSGRITPAHVSPMVSFRRCGRRRARIYNYVLILSPIHPHSSQVI